jgi:D-glycero-D-manno-heptose 1,7-bisphosphate phosphatase
MKTYKIAFLDRDGVINKNINGGYVGYKKQFKWMQGSQKAIKYLKDKNFKVVVITNQSGVARGYFLIKDVQNLHRYINRMLKKNNTKIDKFVFCPYHVDGKVKRFVKKSNLRKPSTGMFNIINKIWKVDKKKSFMIGDQKTDMQFAKKIGIRGYFFNKKNLYEFIKKILKTSNQSAKYI